MAGNSISSGINKLISFLESANEGLNLFMDILNSDDGSNPQIPVIPNYEEVGEYFSNIDDMTSERASALSTYRVFSNSMSAYSTFLVESWNSEITVGEDLSFSEDFKQASVAHIVRVFYEMHTIFDVVQNIKLGSDQYTELLNSFIFMTKLMCGDREQTLGTLYGIDFFDDLSELWEILVETVDAIHDTHSTPTFSAYLCKFNEHITAVNEYTASVLSDNCSKWKKKRILKKYVKIIKVASASMSNDLRTEVEFLKS